MRMWMWTWMWMCMRMCVDTKRIGDLLAQMTMFSKLA